MNIPKQKAKELIGKFIEPTKIPNIKGIWVEDISGAKQCALIAVEQMQLIMDSLWKIQGINEGLKSPYLLEVIKEIEKYE